MMGTTVSFRASLLSLPSRLVADKGRVAELPLDTHGLPTCAFASPHAPTESELSRLLAPPFPVPEGRIVIIQPSFGPSPMETFLLEGYYQQRRTFHANRPLSPKTDRESCDVWEAFIHFVSLSPDEQGSSVTFFNSILQFHHYHPDRAATLARANQHSAALVYIDCAVETAISAEILADLAALYLHPKGRVIAFANANDTDSASARRLEKLQRVLARQHAMRLVSTPVRRHARFGSVTDSVDATVSGYVMIGQKNASVSTQPEATVAAPSSRPEMKRSHLPSTPLDLTPVPARGIQWLRHSPDDGDTPGHRSTRPTRRIPTILPSDIQRPSRGQSVF